MAKYIFKGKGIIWNPEENKSLARFTKGVFQTSDYAVASKLVEYGYSLTDDSDELVKEDKPLEKMTVPELKEYAQVHGIDLGEATKKEDIFNIIQGGQGNANNS